MKDFWLCFVPLFVAVDALGILPLFLSLSKGIEKSRRKAVIFQSVTTASIVSLVFLWCGPFMLGFLGITVDDFMIAGGLLLLAISLSDLLTGEKKQRQADPDSPGAVPIGVPLIAGPAVLTTCILLSEIYGREITSIAVVVNIAIAGFVFLFSDPITMALGRTGTKILSKVASLLLAAIAVMLIRKGVSGIILMISES